MADLTLEEAIAKSVATMTQGELRAKIYCSEGCTFEGLNEGAHIEYGQAMLAWSRAYNKHFGVFGTAVEMQARAHEIIPPELQPSAAKALVAVGELTE